MIWLSDSHGGGRRREPEIMDRPDLPEADHRGALAALARINGISGISGSIWSEIASVAVEGRALRVLDLACGGGDVLLGLAQRAAAQRLPMEFVGLDISPTAVNLARQNAELAGMRVEYRVADVIGDALPADFDVIMCSLFLHHLDDDMAWRLLERMGQAARRKVLVSDLRRSRLGYWLAHVACRVLTRSYVARFDGPASVRAAFSLGEARRLAAQAGLAGARLSRRWPQRFLLAWDREGSRRQ